MFQTPSVCFDLEDFSRQDLFSPSLVYSPFTAVKYTPAKPPSQLHFSNLTVELEESIGDLPKISNVRSLLKELSECCEENSQEPESSRNLIDLPSENIVNIPQIINSKQQTESFDVFEANNSSNFVQYLENNNSSTSNLIQTDFSSEKIDLPLNPSVSSLQFRSQIKEGLLKDKNHSICSCPISQTALIALFTAKVSSEIRKRTAFKANLHLQSPPRSLSFKIINENELCKLNGSSTRSSKRRNIKYLKPNTNENDKEQKSDNNFENVESPQNLEEQPSRIQIEQEDKNASIQKVLENKGKGALSYKEPFYKRKLLINNKENIKFSSTNPESKSGFKKYPANNKMPRSLPRRLRKSNSPIQSYWSPNLRPLGEKKLHPTIFKMTEDRRHLFLNQQCSSANGESKDAKVCLHDIKIKRSQFSENQK